MSQLGFSAGLSNHFSVWSHCRDIVEQLAQVKHPGRIEANGDLSSDLDSLSIRLSRLQLALRNPISEEGQPMTTMTQMLGQCKYNVFSQTRFS